MLPDRSAIAVIARLFIDLVEGRGKDGWNPETREAYAKYCKEQIEPVRQKLREEKVQKVDFRSLGR